MIARIHELPSDRRENFFTFEQRRGYHGHSARFYLWGWLARPKMAESRGSYGKKRELEKEGQKAGEADPGHREVAHWNLTEISMH
jgi:hypothetical protein